MRCSVGRTALTPSTSGHHEADLRVCAFARIDASVPQLLGGDVAVSSKANSAEPCKVHAHIIVQLSPWSCRAYASFGRAPAGLALVQRAVVPGAAIAAHPTAAVSRSALRAVDRTRYDHIMSRTIPGNWNVS
jgi:hypothetical protein